MLDEYGFEIYEENSLPRAKKIVNEFKAYSTRKLHREGEFLSSVKIWSRGASTRYLWKPRHVVAATNYVEYGQDEELIGVFGDEDFVG